MRFLTASVALVALLLSSFTTAQIPSDRQENCGSIISSVISVCSQPELSRPDWCCAELKKWNDARCWCEANAFDALDAVAANGYAYSFRDGFCIAAFERPARGSITSDYVTCPPFGSTPEWDITEQCTNIAPPDLRARRLAALESLRTDAVANEADLGPWFLRMDALFTEDTTFEMVGLFLGINRFEVKQYLMTRQGAYGLMPLTLDFTSGHFWRAPNVVSYMGGVTTPSGHYPRRDFVTFEPCGARIAEWYVVDINYQTRYHQIWNAAETRLMGRYLHTAASWCADVAGRCVGDTYPFDSGLDCQAYFEELQSSGRVTCNRFRQEYVPQFALHGDTVACRSFYLDLALVDPPGACKAVGRDNNQRRCGESQCPGNSYIAPFARDANEMQFTETSQFQCSETTCQENWPSESMITRIPEGQIPGIDVGAGRRTSQAVPREILMTDDDSLMNVEEEDAGAPPDRVTSANMQFGAENMNA